MESLLGDAPQQDHPPCGQRRLLYLGIGRRPEAHSPKSFFLSGYGDECVRWKARLMAGHEGEIRARRELRMQRWLLARRSPSPKAVRD